MINCFPISSPFNRFRNYESWAHYPPGHNDLPPPLLNNKAVVGPGCHKPICFPKKDISFNQNRKSSSICKKVNKPPLVSSFSISIHSPKSSLFFICVFLIYIFLGCALCGCVRQEAQKSGKTDTDRASNASAASTKVVSFQKGSLKLPGTQPKEAGLYIELDSPESKMDRLRTMLEKEAEGRYTIVDNPSRASLIMHITIIYNGQLDENSLKKIVEAGYGSLADVRGQGGIALLADVLLVNRRVPEDKKERIIFLKNVSGRNALESAQMRLGLFSGEKSSRALDAILEQDLVNLIIKSL